MDFRCHGTLRPQAASGAGNGLPNGFGVGSGSGGTSGTGGNGGAGGAGGEDAGACANDSDLQALAGAGSVRDVARDCGLFRCGGSVSDGDSFEACVDACLENDVQGVSSECAACYGALERCGLDSFCQLRCQSDTCSAMCLSCIDQAGCTEEFEACRGITGAECAE